MEQTSGKEIRFSDLLSVLKKCWILLLVVVVVAATVAYLFLSIRHEDKYTSAAKLYMISDSPEMQENDTNMTYYMIQIADLLIVDFAEIAGMEDPVLYPTLDKLGLRDEMTTAELARLIKVEQRGLSRVLEVTVTTTEAKLSADICNTFSETVCEYFNGIYTNGTWEIIRVADTAKVAEKPSNSVSLLLVALIALACAAVVYVVYLVRFLVDDKINSVEDVEKYLGVSTLGIIPNRDVAIRKRGRYGRYGRYGYGRYGAYGMYGKKPEKK